jgi:hypothetical protein
MSCCSIPTRILNINVVHCTFTKDDDREEHYCVNDAGYIALWNYQYEKDGRISKATKLEECMGVMFYQKVRIDHNPNLDGEENGSVTTNPVGCEAKEVIP